MTPVLVHPLVASPFACASDVSEEDALNRPSSPKTSSPSLSVNLEALHFIFLSSLPIQYLSAARFVEYSSPYAVRACYPTEKRSSFVAVAKSEAAKAWVGYINMQILSSLISNSISSAVSSKTYEPQTSRKDLLKSLRAFFALFKLYLTRYRPVNFLHLRREVWGLDEDEYLDSFQQQQQQQPAHQGQRTDKTQSRKGKGREAAGAASSGDLVPVGDLGYSGSTFFTTPNSKYLIKSLPRRFEHHFFTHDLLDPYLEHMKTLPSSLLVRISDLVYTPYPTLGGILGTAPTHHVVMENLLYGQQQSKQGDEDGNSNQTEEMKAWETYDLKPQTYFFPERDIADGKLAPESVKDKLVDEFPDKIRIDSLMSDKLFQTLSQDTQLLADHNAVDYSLFVVRIPTPSATSNPSGRNSDNEVATASIPPIVTDSAEAHNPWRSGVHSTDGQWIYRAIVLDFFWAKHKFQAKAMTNLVNAFNTVANKGPMSITAEPGEYRERFLKMVKELCVVEG